MDQQAQFKGVRRDRIVVEGGNDLIFSVIKRRQH